MGKRGTKGTIMLIYVVNHGSFRPFDDFGRLKSIARKDQMDREGSMLLLHGGEDISPTLYGQKKIPETSASETPSYRDRTEVEAVNRAIELQIPIFGICRGAQLLCAMAGGSLFQHVNNHAGNDHWIKTYTGRTLLTNSLHHQMMNPFDLPKEDYEILAYSKEPQATIYKTDKGELTEIECEPEVIWFPKINALAVQGHPEMMNTNDPFVSWCRSEFIKRVA